MDTITATQLKARLHQEEILVLDIRSPRERMHFHIGGRHVPLVKLQTSIPESLLAFKDKLVVICCSSVSGKRSEAAAKILNKAGFKNIKILAGGIYTWQRIYPKIKIQPL